MASNSTSFDGGCTCRHVRYRMTSRPMFVHCCHCRWCQRESGAAFALNAMIEADRVELLEGEPEAVMTPSASGKGQKIWRCPECRVAVWSNYAGAGDALRFVRVGTLDEPDHLPPDIHIFTVSKQPWVVLPDGTPAVEEYYQASRDVAEGEPGAAARRSGGDKIRIRKLLRFSLGASSHRCHRERSEGPLGSTDQRSLATLGMTAGLGDAASWIEPTNVRSRHARAG